MSIEADIRSKDQKKRRITFILNGTGAVFIGVPETIRFGVCSLSISSPLSNSFTKVSLSEPNETIEFVKLEEVSAENAMKEEACELKF